jgi:hypothetical protein
MVPAADESGSIAIHRVFKAVGFPFRHRRAGRSPATTLNVNPRPRLIPTPKVLNFAPAPVQAAFGHLRTLLTCSILPEVIIPFPEERRSEHELEDWNGGARVGATAAGTVNALLLTYLAHD